MSDKSPPRMSSQMQAVMRIMTGKEERTIAEKLADANRPTWEQYKKDNEDKLNLSGADQKKMEEYRRELDEQREKILSRGLNRKGKKRHDNSESDTDSYDDERTKKKKKKSKKRKKRRRRREESSSDSEEERHRKKKKRKKESKKDDSDRYRLSNFFNSTKGGDDGG